MIKGKIYNPDNKLYEDFYIDDELETKSEHPLITYSIKLSTNRGPSAGFPFLILLEQLQELEKEKLIKDLEWEDNNDDPPDTIY